MYCLTHKFKKTLKPVFVAFFPPIILTSAEKGYVFADICIFLKYLFIFVIQKIFYNVWTHFDEIISQRIMRLDFGMDPGYF